MATNHYFFLSEGDTIREGDEVEMSANYNDDPVWVVGNPKNIGTKAPNPNFISHRVYRRKLTIENFWNAESSTQRDVMLVKLFEIINSI